MSRLFFGSTLTRSGDTISTWIEFGSLSQAQAEILNGGFRLDVATTPILTAERMPNPHHVLNTSPDKHQILWSVEKFEQDQAENLVRAMAIGFGVSDVYAEHDRAPKL